MMRKFRRIFRSPTTTTIKNEPIHPTSTSSDSIPDNISNNKQKSSVTNHLCTESSDTNRISSTDDLQYAKMRIISSPVFQLRDIIHTLLTTSTPPCDLISTFLTYGQSLGATSIHGYLVDRCYETQTLINDDFSSYQGVALCITYDIKLSEQQWEDIFGIHESKSITSKTTSSFFHLTDFLCILSGSRVVYYDPNERMINDERSYVSIFDLENDDIDIFQDQFSPLDYFLLKSKTFYNGTLIRLPLRTPTTTILNNPITTKIQTLDDIKQQILKYFSSNHSFIELLLIQTNINRIEFDYTKDFQQITKFLSIEKQFLSTINDIKSTTQILQLNISKLINNINQNDSIRWILSIHNEIDQLKLLLPLIPFDSSLSQIYNYQSIQITSTRILYYYYTSKLLLSTNDLCTQLQQIKFPQAYALFLKDLSRLIKPTITSLNLSMDLIWELMPNIDEQDNIQIINNIIPDIWREIGKQELFYSVTDGWGYVAIEDMIINNVQSGPIQDVLTYVFSEANAPIVILPSHVINCLCKYSNKHYLQVMTPFHASELLTKNSSILSNLTFEQKINLLKYIILNDPDPGLVLDLELLPLANNTFTTFKTKQTNSIIYIIDNKFDYLKLFPSKQHEKFLCPNLDENLFEKLSSQNFQGKIIHFYDVSLIEYM